MLKITAAGDAVDQAEPVHDEYCREKKDSPIHGNK